MPHNQLSDRVTHNTRRSFLSRLGPREPAIIRRHFQKLCLQIIHTIWNILRMSSFSERHLFHFHVVVGKVNTCFPNAGTVSVRLTRSCVGKIIRYICPNTNDILLEFFCFLLQRNFSKIQTDSVPTLINPFIKQAQQSKIHCPPGTHWK